MKKLIFALCLFVPGCFAHVLPMRQHIVTDLSSGSRAALRNHLVSQVLFRAQNRTAGGGGYSGPTAVQACSNQVGSGSTVTCTFPGNITAGHPLYFCTTPVALGPVTTAWSGDSGTFTPDPGTGTPITDILWDSVDGIEVTCAYVASAGGGGNAITADYGANGVVGGIVGIELSGGTFDQSDAGTGASTLSASPITSNAITPAANNSLLIGVCFYAANSTLGVGSNVAWSLGSAWTYVNYVGLIESFGQTTATSTTSQCASSLTTYYYWGHVVAFH